MTLTSSTAAFHLRLLYATRYLQIPEGRAFLLDQIRRRTAILPFNSYLAYLCRERGLAAALARKLCTASRTVATDDDRRPVSLADPTTLPPLDLRWPSDAPLEPSRILTVEAYTPQDPVVLSDNLLDWLA